MAATRERTPATPHSNVFLGQNWATLNNTPFRQWKHFAHEGGSSTPLIAHWPSGIDDLARNKLEHQPGHVIDLMPTVVDVAAASIPTKFQSNAIEPLEGVSLKPAFTGKTLARSQPIFFDHEDNRAVRDGKWKLVVLAGQPWELYDIEADRTELHDLAAQHPDRVKTMAAQYDAWARRTHVVTGNNDAWNSSATKQNKGR